MSALSQLDDNLVVGQTYTFEIHSSDWVNPSTNTVQQDLINNAPAFVANSLQVQSNFGSSDYYCQFTYNGDGSDVVSDVGAAIVEAVHTGSGNVMTFVSASAAPIQFASVGDAVGAVGATARDALSGVASGVGSSVQSVLTPVEILLVVAIGLVALLIFTSGKAGGVAGGPEGFKIGG